MDDDTEVGLVVSIHAPREGCDEAYIALQDAKNKFQFTHPGRGATDTSTRDAVRWVVSIHAPREGCDIDEAREGVIAHRVSIHAPREGCDLALSCC